MKHDRIRVEGDHLPADFYRAQALISGHIANIDAALAAVKRAKGKLLPSIADMHVNRLRTYRARLAGDLDNALAAPLGAFALIGNWNHNGHGPTIEDACKSARESIANAASVMAYRAELAARRAGVA